MRVFIVALLVFIVGYFAISRLGGFVDSKALAGESHSMIGKPAPKFELISTEGKKIIFPDDFKGKYILLNFWATWCPPCRTEIPLLNSLHKDLKSYRFEVVGAMPAEHDDFKLSLQKFIKKIPMDYSSYEDTDAKGYESYGSESYPTSYLVSPNGTIVDKIEGNIFEHEMVRVSETVKQGVQNQAQ